MSEFINSSVFMGVTLTFLAYGTGVVCNRITKSAVFNPILISVVLIIAFLAGFNIDYEVYERGSEIISYLLTPATICLAIPLYVQFELLKKNFPALMIGISTGVITSLISVLALSALFGLNHSEYVTFLPKSITTAIGMGISEELGGSVAITVTVIITTGIIGNTFAGAVCKICRITDPVAAGVAIGTASHALGTARAFEMGITEGAVSSLSMVISGLLTVVGANIFSVLM